MSEKIITETHTISTTYKPSFSNDPGIKMDGLDFQERCDTLRKAVIDVLRDTYGEDRGEKDELVASSIELLYAQRENELVRSIFEYIMKEFSWCMKESEEAKV